MQRSTKTTQQIIKQLICFSLPTVILSVLIHPQAQANPNGATIINGQVSINTSTPSVMNITNSPNAIINWQGFSIQQHEITRFIQQNGKSAVLNRIIGQNPSQIMGQLLSNGKVFLINPNGIVFGTNSRIDTQSLIASTLNLSNQDFLTGNYHFTAGNGAGNILNEGIIRVGQDGNIILIAPNIENNGIISTEGGQITLAAGEELTLTNLDEPEIQFQIQAPDNQVLNLGKVLTGGGVIELFAGSITHSGELNANSIEIDQQGHIRLFAQQDITLTEQSITTASNTAGDAGTITIESQQGTSSISGTIEVKAENTGAGGSIQLLGKQIELLDRVKLDASGENRSGILILNPANLIIVGTGSTLPIGGDTVGFTVNILPISGGTVVLTGGKLINNGPNLGAIRLVTNGQFSINSALLTVGSTILSRSVLQAGFKEINRVIFSGNFNTSLGSILNSGFSTSMLSNIDALTLDSVIIPLIEISEEIGGVGN